MNCKYPVLIVSALLISTAPAFAHEMWLDGADYEIDQNEKIVSDIKVGQNFFGSNYSFFPNNFQRFDIAISDMVKPVEGRLGDRPAVNIDPLGGGLNVLVYQSNLQDVFYTEWAKFTSFVEHKDFGDALENHAARNLPQEKFRELYTRYAKSLIAVGNGEGQDRAYGLETEIVALENPYTDDLSDGLDIKVLYREMPRINAQVEIFERSPQDDVEVNVFTARTNENGIATIAVKPGHTYQLDAVVLREPAEELAQKMDAVWESLWANMTFAVPDAKS